MNGPFGIRNAGNGSAACAAARWKVANTQRQVFAISALVFAIYTLGIRHFPTGSGAGGDALPGVADAERSD